jgi:hypothetical protein
MFNHNSNEPPSIDKNQQLTHQAMMENEGNAMQVQ